MSQTELLKISSPSILPSDAVTVVAGLEKDTFSPEPSLETSRKKPFRRFHRKQQAALEVPEVVPNMLSVSTTCEYNQNNEKETKGQEQQYDNAFCIRKRKIVRSIENIDLTNYNNSIVCPIDSVVVGNVKSEGNGEILLVDVTPRRHRRYYKKKKEGLQMGNEEINPPLEHATNLETIVQSCTTTNKLTTIESTPPEQSLQKKSKRRFIRKPCQEVVKIEIGLTDENTTLKRKRLDNESTNIENEPKSRKQVDSGESNESNNILKTKIILIAEKAKQVLSNIESKKVHYKKLNKPIVRVGEIVNKTESFFINSQVSDEYFIFTFLKANPLQNPIIPSELLWKRICKILVACFDSHINQSKEFFSGEDASVASLLNWLIELAPTMAKLGITPFEFSTSPIRRTEKTPPKEDMTNFKLSVDVIMKQKYEVATKLLQFFTDLFYLNCEIITKNSYEVSFFNTKGQSLFSSYIKSDASIVETIKDRMLHLFKGPIRNFTSLHLDQKLCRQFKNYSKLLACFFMETSEDFRHLTVTKKEMEDLPEYVKYSLYRHVFAFAFCEKTCCKFMEDYLGLKGSTLEKTLKSQLKVLRSGKKGLTEFELCKLYLILKASKKIMENNHKENSNIELSVQEFETCKKFLENIYDGIISRSKEPIDEKKATKKKRTSVGRDIMSWDYILGIKMIRKLRKYVTDSMDM